MAKAILTILAGVGVGSALSACATSHRTDAAAANGAEGRVNVAYAGAAMVTTTVGETYNGLGGAFRGPLRDFNLMQEKIPAALFKAKGDVYDTAGLDSCAAIAEAIQQLDLALGPDLDTPRVENQRTRSQRLASAAADGAVSAARGALDHYIPVRGVVRQVTGARKYEKEASRATLAGNVRRGFLKAIGMQHDCAWPASPIKFKPKPAMASVQLASDATSPAAAAGVSASLPIANAASAKMTLATASPPAAPAGSVVRNALLIDTSRAAEPGAAPVKLVQVATAQTTPPAPAALIPSGPQAPAVTPQSAAVTLVADHGAAPSH